MIVAGIDLDMRRVEEEGFEVAYIGPHGQVFNLAVPGGMEGQRVTLAEAGIAGVSARVSRTTKQGVGRVGVRVTGHTVTELSGSLSVVIEPGAKSLANTFREWRRAWSIFNDGMLQVVDRSGGNFHTRVRLDGQPESPPVDPHGEQGMRDTIGWIGVDGCWWGVPRAFSGTTDVVVDGDLSPSCRLRWDGQSTSMTFPGGATLNVDAAPGLRFIDLDYTMSGRVTREDGTVDGAVWSSLRGQVFGVELEPHVSSQWQLGPGLTLEATPRYLSPWR